MSAVASILFLVLQSSAGASADWGCYDPQPGHPTEAERASFVANVSPLASAAERAHGVPASAIAAMAILESGYGWTRTALNARNYFGWKYFGSNAAGGRAKYTLGCQPPEDRGNDYIVFSDMADAVDFVAAKLSKMDYYRSDREKYLRDRQAGVAAAAATLTWLSGISDPYTGKPVEYVEHLRRIMNDPISPSALRSESSLYLLSEAIGYGAQPASPAQIAPAALPAHNAADDPPAATSAAITEAEAYYNSNPPQLECEATKLDFPNWLGYPVRRCRYSESGVSAWTYMLNPDPAKLARWTVLACVDAGANPLAKCVTALESEVTIASSNGIFPVAGFIPERARDAGGAGDEVLCILFRDGVTAKTRSWPAQAAATGGGCPDASEYSTVVTHSRTYARVASTTRNDYRAAGGTEPVGTDGNQDPRWSVVVRSLYQQAWNSDRNFLLYAKAKSLLGH